METYLTLSFLNDFIFCPRSIYFHGLFQKYNTRYYQSKPQLSGTAAHKTIDNKTYSTRKDIYQSLEIYSEKYKICGKIDLYDAHKKLLIERKNNIKQIYDGYVFQVYAQYYCLTEMGYSVDQIVIRDLTANKSYPIPTPPNSPEWRAKFEELMERIGRFKLLDPSFEPLASKCENCIYSNLCDYSLC